MPFLLPPLPPPHISRPISKHHLSRPTFSPLYILSTIIGAIRSYLLPFSILFIILPSSPIFYSISMTIHTMPIGLAFFSFTRIHIPTRVIESPKTFWLIIHSISSINWPVCPSLRTLSFSYLVLHRPFISCSIIYSFSQLSSFFYSFYSSCSSLQYLISSSFY